MSEHKYFIFKYGCYEKLHIREMVKYVREQEQSAFLWSARLGTGLFGLTSCPAGNRGPKSDGEVLLALGDEGLVKLVELGFITCPVCRPDSVEGFWAAVQGTATRMYGVGSLEEFIDKDKIPFDARRLVWEEILPVVGKTPSRLYVPNGLDGPALVALDSRFRNIGFALPEVGYYDRDSETKFSRYAVPGSS
ncbi:hypothetical protein JW898_03230 [Candidatus Woesearchaeota archaeon]|nr:hypothetical protein [Candidatus Woesearchaeota archaeon]